MQHFWTEYSSSHPCQNIQFTPYDFCPTPINFTNSPLTINFSTPATTTSLLGQYLSTYCASPSPVPSWGSSKLLLPFLVVITDTSAFKERKEGKSCTFLITQKGKNSRCSPGFGHPGFRWVSFFVSGAASLSFKVLNLKRCSPGLPLIPGWQLTPEIPGHFLALRSYFQRTPLGRGAAGLWVHLLEALQTCSSCHRKVQ